MIIERRFCYTEVRLIDTGQASSPGVAQGYAATYNRKSSDLGKFKEKIAPTAFQRSLKSGDDVHCFLNHDVNFPLGRCANKTLQLSSDSKGLQMRCILPPTTAGRDVAALLNRGDLADMSFAFQVHPDGESWSEEDDCECGSPDCDDPNCERSRTKIRTLHSVKLIDTSIVAQPAYPGTAVHLSSINPAMVGRSHGAEFPEGMPAEMRSRLGLTTRSLEQAQSRRRHLSNLVIGL
jgi:HK97 family phage prohead protease